MLKVIIADDEVRVCQLIQALIDWENIGMEIAGIAHNGLEAVDLVKSIRPDILITDIRMPGCSGLELIEAVRESVSELEIVIISGYAHFEYAQSAIKFGVGDYLLKPIDQSELNATLLKLRERIVAKKEFEEDKLQLIQKSENDIRRIRASLIDSLVEQKEIDLSMESLREAYYVQAEPGIFQAFWLKVDCGGEALGQAGLIIVLDRVQNVLEGSLRGRCRELVLCVRDGACIGMMNYDRRKQDEIRRVLKDCLNQLEAQRGLFGPVAFSLAVGTGAEQSERLARSMREASVIIQERLVKGTGRLLDHMPGESAVYEQNIPEKYLRGIAAAIEVMSAEDADRAASQIWDAVREVKDIHGYELLDLVHTCGGLFLSQMEVKAPGEELRRFDEQCGQCGNVEELAAALAEMQRKYIEELRQKHESDSVRPIRLAKQYIRNHFSDQITLEEVSGVAGLSTAYFSALFKKEEGEGFAKYLIGVRIDQAKLLLRETNRPVAEICKKVGYNDLKHFTRTFEKVTGVKPATYRKLYG